MRLLASRSPPPAVTLYPTSDGAAAFVTSTRLTFTVGAVVVIAALAALFLAYDAAVRSLSRRAHAQKGALALADAARDAAALKSLRAALAVAGSEAGVLSAAVDAARLLFPSAVGVAVGSVGARDDASAVGRGGGGGVAGVRRASSAPLHAPPSQRSFASSAALAPAVAAAAGGAGGAAVRGGASSAAASSAPVAAAAQPPPPRASAGAATDADGLLDSAVLGQKAYSDWAAAAAAAAPAGAYRVCRSVAAPLTAGHEAVGYIVIHLSAPDGATAGATSGSSFAAASAPPHPSPPASSFDPFPLAGDGLPVAALRALATAVGGALYVQRAAAAIRDGIADGLAASGVAASQQQQQPQHGGAAAGAAMALLPAGGDGGGGTAGGTAAGRALRNSVSLSAAPAAAAAAAARRSLRNSSSCVAAVAVGAGTTPGGTIASTAAAAAVAAAADAAADAADDDDACWAGDACLAADVSLLRGWTIDADAAPRPALHRLMASMLRSLGLDVRFAISHEAFAEFTERVEQAMPANPFHKCVHDCFHLTLLHLLVVSHLNPFPQLWACVQRDLGRVAPRGSWAAADGGRPRRRRLPRAAAGGRVPRPGPPGALMEWRCILFGF